MTPSNVDMADYGHSRRFRSLADTSMYLIARGTERLQAIPDLEHAVTECSMTAVACAG